MEPTVVERMVKVVADTRYLDRCNVAVDARLYASSLGEQKGKLLGHAGVVG